MRSQALVQQAEGIFLESVILGFLLVASVQVDHHGLVSLNPHQTLEDCVGPNLCQLSLDRRESGRSC